MCIRDRCGYAWIKRPHPLPPIRSAHRSRADRSFRRHRLQPALRPHHRPLDPPSPGPRPRARRCALRRARWPGPLSPPHPAGPRRAQAQRPACARDRPRPARRHRRAAQRLGRAPLRRRPAANPSRRSRPQALTNNLLWPQPRRAAHPARIAMLRLAHRRQHSAAEEMLLNQRRHCLLYTSRCV